MATDEQDFVWGEMLSYWEHTNQIGPGEASAWGYLTDDETWRGLGYQISYGAPYDGVDPQTDVEHSLADVVSSCWADLTASENESLADTRWSES